LKKPRLFLGGLPRLLRDILEVILRDHGVEVICCADLQELLTGTLHPDDGVVLGTYGDAGAFARRLVADSPDINLLVVQHEGRFVERLGRRRLMMVDPSLDMLVAVIRSFREDLVLNPY